MLAVHQHSYDRSAIKLGQLPIPKPPKSHVLIRVKAAGLNPVDFKRSGEEDFPIVLGYDVAGVVHELGEGVTMWKVGDNVFGDIMSHSMGPKFSGTVAEYCICPEHLLARLPDNVKMTDAAATPVAAETAVGCLRMLNCKPGHRVFISGGSGGVGVHAIQIAKALFGASEVATTATGPKIEFVKSLGADKVVDYRNEDAGTILEGWADVAIDGTSETDMIKKILKPGGEMLTIADYTKPDIKFFMLCPTQELVSDIATMLEQGTMKAVVDSVYPLSEWEAAIKHLLEGRPRGKVVIQVE